MAEHATVQTDMVLEKEWRVLYLDREAAKGEFMSHLAQLEHMRPQNLLQ